MVEKKKKTRRSLSHSERVSQRRKPSSKNRCTNFCRNTYIPETLRNMDRLLDHSRRKQNLRKSQKVKMKPFPPTKFKNHSRKYQADSMRHCKSLYCNPGCSGFVPIKGSTKWIEPDSDDYHVLREPTSYWESVRGNPLANFTDRNSLNTIVRLRRKGAKSMCARDSMPFSAVNPDWLNKYKLEKFK